MAQQGRGVGSHPDEPPPKRRTLQIKLGRPRPPAELDTPEQASPSLNRSRPTSSLGGIRISLKRKAPAFDASQSTPTRFSNLHDSDDDEQDEDVDDGEVDDQPVASADASDQDDGEDEEGDQDDDEDREDGEEDEDEEDEEGDEDAGGADAGSSAAHGRTDANGISTEAGASGDNAPAPRLRGKNGAFKSTSNGSSSNPFRRPIKRLRSKGLYEAIPKLIENLQRRDSYKFFCEPVNPDEVPGYFDVIKTPMDFGTMQRKVDDRLYSHMDEFKADFQLVISNAQTFNPEGTLYHNEAKRIATWGNRAIEREGMAVNDNGRAGVKGDELRRQKRMAREAASIATGGGIIEVADASGRRVLRGAVQQQNQALQRDASIPPLGDGPVAAGLDAAGGEMTTRLGARGSQFAFSAGVEAIMEAARVTSQARQRAAFALGLTSGTLTREDSAQPGGGAHDGDANMDLDDDDDMDPSDDEGARAGFAGGRDSRERSVTVDGPAGSGSRRFGSSQPGGTPSTPMGQRQASPDALRKRLAAVTGTPIQALASPMGPGTLGGTGKASKQKLKQRLGAPGTPKRLLARTGLAGSATPGAGAESGAEAAGTPGLATDPSAAAAAAAQLMANLPQTQLQPGSGSYSFDDDGSINPDDIEDLHTFLTLHRTGRHVLMPTLESLHPIGFIPGDYTGSGAGDKPKPDSAAKDKEAEKGKEKAKDKADEGDDDDDDGKGESKEKGDKDPLSSLPPARPGAPDPLYSAIAPEPERLHTNLSHDVEPLPPHFRNLPFLAPSIAPKGAREVDGLPHSWSNPAYVEAIKNDKRPKKQKDKEREREKETLEDWSYFRPTLTRLLEITDLGPFGALVPAMQASDSLKAASQSKSGTAAKQDDDDARDHGLPTTALAQDGLEAIKAELQHKREGFTLPRNIKDRFVEAARTGEAKRTGAFFTERERQDASRIVADMVYGGVEGSAYVRSVAEFVSGATQHAMLLDEADDAYEQRLAQAEAQLVAAAALRKAREAEPTPEPTAASRRGPFQWRDSTEEAGTSTPAAEEADANLRSAGHTAAATPEKIDDAPAMPDSIEPSEVAVPELAPLPVALAQLVEEEVVRPITRNSLDVLHLVAAYLQTHADAPGVELIEARLARNKLHAHQVEGIDPAALAALAVPPPCASQPMPAPLPFSSELEWLQSQPELTRLLDEAHQDVNSLGSIVNYVIQSA
ncbi:IRF-2-binding protein CELTIX-1 [Moesziomyces antarcticus T-34]|uniref:IRF-2-binding protein CELTIX-1 n=1 Tax=Pseudozyma antarctica (strain T-34) TaxID=1151754 RepID=M9LYR6_PSEA3|nr:IRF-2-binding protein CELTIX-1 [Moesziomyces antarcticus T-34]